VARWHVYTPVPTLGFGIMIDSMLAYCQATNRSGEEGIRSGFRKVGAFDPGKPLAAFWCFKPQKDASEFKAWCEDQGVVVGNGAADR
jgi:hypothetical protein